MTTAAPSAAFATIHLAFTLTLFTCDPRGRLGSGGHSLHA